MDDVCNEGARPWELLDTLSELTDLHLAEPATQADGPPRFRLFETIRHFAREELRCAGEWEVIADRHAEYAGQVQARLGAAGLKVALDERQEKIGYKIREAQLQKIPYMLVVGDREQAEGKVAVRHRSGGDQGSIGLDEFIAQARDEVSTRASQPALAEAGK